MIIKFDAEVGMGQVAVNVNGEVVGHIKLGGGFVTTPAAAEAILRVGYKTPQELYREFYPKSACVFVRNPIVFDVADDEEDEFGPSPRPREDYGYNSVLIALTDEEWWQIANARKEYASQYIAANGVAVPAPMQLPDFLKWAAMRGTAELAQQYAARQAALDAEREAEYALL